MKKGEGRGCRQMPGTAGHLKDGKPSTVKTFWNYMKVILMMFPSNGGYESQLAISCNLVRLPLVGLSCWLKGVPWKSPNNQLGLRQMVAFCKLTTGCHC